MSAGYDEDFFEWTHHSAELLRSGNLAALDIEHLAEEIEDLGKRDRREAGSRLRVILKHLAKWQMQPERRERSTWRSTIVTQRGQLAAVLADSPSLRRYLNEQTQKLYSQALEETRLEGHSLPAECPFTLEQALDEQFFPE